MNLNANSNNNNNNNHLIYLENPEITVRPEIHKANAVSFIKRVKKKSKNDQNIRIDENIKYLKAECLKKMHDYEVANGYALAAVKLEEMKDENFKIRIKIEKNMRFNLLKKDTYVNDYFY